MIDSPIGMNFLYDAGQDEQSSIVNQAADDTGNVHGAGTGNCLSRTDDAQVDQTDGSKADGSQMGESKGKGMVGGLRELLMMLFQTLIQWFLRGGDAEYRENSTGLQSMDGGTQVSSFQAGPQE
jgi:hypothetical protein